MQSAGIMAALRHSGNDQSQLQLEGPLRAPLISSQIHFVPGVIAPLGVPVTAHRF